MEPDAMVEMFSRSESLYNVRYAYYIGDGDSKTHKSIQDAKPYGDFPVVKKECIGHVQKRLGTRLRNLKKEVKNLGGRGKLTGKLIDELSVYYGLAIRRNTDSVENMRKEIYATLYHKISTDEKPQHDRCPAGADSWCSWQRAKASIFNDSKIMDFLIVQNQYESLHLDSYFDMNPQINMWEIDALFSFPRYLKALIVLRMFQSAITDKVFRNNVHTYVNRYTFSSMISFDFWSMQEPIKAFKCYIPSNKFLTWITYRHYQIVYFEREADSYMGRLSQKYNPTGHIEWWIPINLKNYKLRSTETLFTEKFTTCLTPDSPSVILHVQQIDWVYDWIVNIQQAGYYRVKYDLKGWHAIANYLNSTAGEYEGISVINRAKIIDDAFHLMMEHQLDVSIFWNLTQFLSQETNYVVWYPMIKVFEYMSTIFPYSEGETRFIDIKAKFRELLDNPLTAILDQKHLMENVFTESFKQEILKWSCALKHNQCIRRAKDTLKDHLHNTEIEPVSSEWKHWTYCRGLILCYHDYHSIWFDAIDIWLRKPDHDLLPFLVCCETDWIITEQLTYLFLNRFTQNEREDVAVIRSYINIFHSIVSKHANTYNILREILLNLEKIKPKEINTLTALTDIINYVYSISILNQASKFNSNFIFVLFISFL
ncbi:Aminopeptidase N [Trachymyrmex cornetzi]|uniref:Aminopeptidase N n=1 Tax=Trachymyrmex cornetzi TaxID=471704 RepID=A0A195DD28_9HYME|nr:Aminopeptidase N [Trachymyrmex cornetzi]